MDDTKPLSKLRSLKLNRNRLESIDISGMPHLRHLQLDRNQVSSIKGLPSAHHLKSLSLREQDQPLFGPKCHLVFDDFYELRELYLSGNVIQTPLSPRRQFLNMQHLELANVGLTALPRKFGSRFRNLRTLNLNYNAISEVEELRGLIRLKSLMLAGNRLSRLRKTAAVLKKVGGYLEVLDLRDNPVTIGFYAATPAPEGATTSCPSPSGVEEKRGASPFAKPATPAAADAAYRRRLDEDTRLRRRVYELLMVAAAASKLQTLDGVELDRPAVKQEDADWRRLVEMGILRNKTAV
ncbi:MAG: hypothetical protein M1825_000210 [Sarcosagium campestre]|nr:MAG: hypothetical protein M1825_000210 [Sarcosagium campestre]